MILLYNNSAYKIKKKWIKYVDDVLIICDGDGDQIKKFIKN